MGKLLFGFFSPGTKNVLILYLAVDAIQTKSDHENQIKTKNSFVLYYDIIPFPFHNRAIGQRKSAFPVRV